MYSITIFILFAFQNLMGFERSVQGVAGVLGAYKTALRSTTLYGPTNFSPTIDDYAYKCRNFPKDASKYQVYLKIISLALIILLKFQYHKF